MIKCGKWLSSSVAIVNKRWNSGFSSQVAGLKTIPKQERKNKPEWVKRDISIKQRYGEWNPSRKLSRRQMQDVRSFLEQAPHLRTVDLAKYFKISPEAIRRILSSKWVPKESEEDAVLERDRRRKERNKQQNKYTQDGLNVAISRLNHGRSKPFDQVAVEEIRYNGKAKFNSSRNYNKRGRKPYNKSLNELPIDIADTID